MEIFDDKEAHDAWNWVLEMYGYAIATYRAGQHVNMRVSGRAEAVGWGGVG